MTSLALRALGHEQSSEKVYSSFMCFKMTKQMKLEKEISAYNVPVVVVKVKSTLSTFVLSIYIERTSKRAKQTID